MRAIFGADRIDSGQIEIHGELVRIDSPKRAAGHGIGFVPEDRQHDGYVESFTVAENLVLNRSREAGFSQGLSLNLNAIADNANAVIGEYDIRTESIRKLAGQLSGGNAQKLVLARELSRELAVLVASQPTRGVDVGAKVEIYNAINNLIRQGIGVIMISSEMPEILGMSDRILIMCEGRKTGELTREEATQEVILKYATGQEA